MQLKVVLGALQQWGDDFIPPEVDTTTERVASRSASTVRVGFVEDPPALLPVDEAAFNHLPQHPLYASEHGSEPASSMTG